MKIKLAILENDVGYLNRISSVFAAKYSDKLEIHSFTDPNEAMSKLREAKIDVFLSCDFFDIDVSALPNRCAFAYFADSDDVKTIRQQPTICKFQKGELIYKQILNLYSEKTDSILGHSNANDAKVLFFTSVSGGAGTSSVAAACALHIASENKKVLYLNLEKYGSADPFFSADGNFNISDVIFALKGKKTNLSIKLESYVKCDHRGVYFFSSPRLALDLMELTIEEINELINTLRSMGEYDCIIIDTDLNISSGWMDIYRRSDAVVWVSSNSKTAASKLRSAYNSVFAKEQNADSPLTNRIYLIMNNTCPTKETAAPPEGIRLIGSIPYYENISFDKIISEISAFKFFDRIG